MFRHRSAPVVAASLVALGALAGCSEDKEIIRPPVARDARFERYVALGNSITAGFQSSGINDSTQRESYAFLLAQQMQTRYAYPALALPGCPPPVINFQTQARLGGTSAPPCALRTPISITAALNNVAVPGATSLDPTSPTTPASSALTTFILGGKTQVQRAADAEPTFFTAWIGNNDVLDAATRGVIVPTPGLAPTGVTPLATFQSRYDGFINELRGISSIEGGVLIGVVQVANAPVVFPAAALSNAAFKAGFDMFVGKTTTVLPDCTASPSLISFGIVTFLRSRPADEPAVIGCEKGSIPENPIVGDWFILDADEQATLTATVNAYNSFIQARANANNFAYIDPNVTLAVLRADQNCVRPIPNLASTTAPFGTCISLDGVHPARAAHLAFARALITAINTKYGTSIPTVP